MSNQTDDDGVVRRVLPRNLPARADYLVPGNPMTSRPESGVANSHPGLEVDVRALDRHFLPGLVFDFQYRIGAKLVHIDPKRHSGRHVPTSDEMEQGLFLWAVRGRFGNCPSTVQTVPLLDVDGYMVLRRIMDLEPGPLTVMIGYAPRTARESRESAALIEAFESGVLQAPVQRTEDRLVYTCVDGKRAAFLCGDGVLDPDLIPPGELTQTLCSPWQWDFADCHCYYWASSKPDIVIGVAGDLQTVNFLRNRDALEPERPARDPAGWRKDVLTQKELITEWETLPVVIAEREGATPRYPHWPEVPKTKQMSLDKIAQRLPVLAEREHALAVEYLYAAYSINAPALPPSAWHPFVLRRYRAAHEIFEIAIDEMRHFRWVNEALWLLNRLPSVKRAQEIQPDLSRSFRLRPLLPSALNEFIGIEAPSSIFDADPQQLAGMYTDILASLNLLEQAEKDPKQQDTLRRVKQLVKVIIDEGDGHFDRFRRVKRFLAGSRPGSYLRFTVPPGKATEEPWRSLQGLADTYYDLLLRALSITFFLGRHSASRWLSIARKAMDALNECAYRLVGAKRPYAPLFSLPAWVGPPTKEYRGEPAHQAVETRTLDNVKGDVDEITLCARRAQGQINVIEAEGGRRFLSFVIEHRAILKEIEALRAEYAGESDRRHARSESTP